MGDKVHPEMVVKFHLEMLALAVELSEKVKVHQITEHS